MIIKFKQLPAETDSHGPGAHKPGADGGAANPLGIKQYKHRYSE